MSENDGSNENDLQDNCGVCSTVFVAVIGNESFNLSWLAIDDDDEMENDVETISFNLTIGATICFVNDKFAFLCERFRFVEWNNSVKQHERIFLRFIRDNFFFLI